MSEDITIAVIDIDSQDLSKSACISLSNVVRKELLKTGNFRVVDRNNMQEILDEHGFQQSGLCTDLACMVKLGQLLGVRKMLGGSIGKLGKKYIIDLKLVDVETGQIEKMESENYVGAVEELDNPISIVTRKIIGIADKIDKKTFIYVSSNPEGSKVYLNGDLKGNSPINIEVNREGEYEVRIVLEGFIDWQQKVYANKNKRTFVNAELAKKEKSDNVSYLLNGDKYNQYDKEKKSLTKALTLSLIPGVGQFYSNKSYRGILYVIGISSAILLYTSSREKEHYYSYHFLDVYDNHYSGKIYQNDHPEIHIDDGSENGQPNEERIFEIVSGKDYTEKSDTIDLTHWDRRVGNSLYIYLGAGVYAVSIVDALLSTHSYNEKLKKKYNITLSPYIDRKQSGIYLTYYF